MYYPRKYAPTIFVFLLLSPIVFIDPKHSHDWGDDFAQYIHQAINLVEGIPQSETGYIFNPDSYLGPKAYPIGFPILLSPVYVLFGNNIFAFTTYISILLVLTGLVVFSFHRAYFSFITSLILTMIVVFHPWTLNFKAEVMSDIPFMLFMYLSILLYQRSKHSALYLIVCAIVVAFTMHIRSIGVILPLVFIVDNIRQKAGIDESGYFKKHGKFLLQFILPAAIVFFLLKYLFPLPGTYSLLVDWSNFKAVVLRNMEQNVAVYNYFFNYYGLGEWKFVSTITGCVFVTFWILGFVKKISEQFDYLDLLFVLYFLIIVVYPFGSAVGFRFLFPLLPLIMNYTVIAYKSFNIDLFLNKKKVGVFLSLLLFIQYSGALLKMIDCRKCELEGPFEKESVEAFEYIRSNTDAGSNILFFKPRALALYTARNGYDNRINDNVESIQERIIQNKINYVLIHDQLSDDSLKALIATNGTFYQPLWRNNKFSFYKVNKSSF